MAKVFRLHEGVGGTSWFVSKPLTSEQLKTIKTAGKDAATSIPSPFARIDLVKSAFRWVTENGINGNTAYHKLVSDALDIGQLFFSSAKYAKNIEIIAWNPKERLKELIDASENIRHSKFAETLKIYWDQDSVTEKEKGNLVLYNFEKVKRLYFIINKETNQVIGGTSPATLFMAAPDVREASSSLNITCGHNKLFDDEYASLAIRETSFIEYILTLTKQADFASYFPEFYAYVEAIRLNHLPSDVKSRVSTIESDSLNNYNSCPVLNNINDPCEVLGIRLGLRNVDISEIESQSQFVIRNEIFHEGLRPLILPNETFSNKWIYTTEGIFWDKNTSIPARNSKSPEDSVLPVQGDKYYWLSIGNFLEDKIIELPYTIDPTKFETCGIKKMKYLLPLTLTFFNFFKSEDAGNLMSLQELAGGGIEVKLEIPVAGGKITYKKIYSNSEKVKIDAHLSILPFLRSESTKLDYTIGLIDDRRNPTGNLIIRCYEKGKDVQVTNPVLRNPGKDDVKSLYYKVPGVFDTIRFGINTVNGCIIPKMKLCHNSTKIDFAIDFGTTNTHIEYSYGSKIAAALDNTTDAPFWQSLMNRSDNSIDPLVRTNEETFENEMMPYEFSKDHSQIHFPVRTALVHNRHLDFTRQIEVFKDANNYMLFEKRRMPHYLDLFTQLKWSNYSDEKDEIKVKSFIEYLVTVVYYKALLLDGDISKTSITWFYPVSMDEGELGVFFKLWKEMYKKVFHLEPGNDRIKGIPESIAPYLYYKSKIAGLSLSIDIGGGSSDIAVFDENNDNAILISSFKFAGNAIFGDGFPSKGLKNNSDRNGYVIAFLEEGQKAVSNDKKPILDDIINDRKDSADFSSFLFSLEDDPANQFSYSRLLIKDKRLKLPFFVFYGAIAYYSANLLKRSGIEIPKHILLSGTASKTASILDSSGDELRNLSSMFKFIFEKVYNQKIGYEMDILLSPIPKEITCKGGLIGIANHQISENNIMFWLGGLGENEWGLTVNKEKDINRTPKYIQIDDTAKFELEETIKNYFSLLDEYVSNIKLEAKYIIETEAYEVFRKMRESNIRDYLIRGLKAYYKKDDNHIEETLFFYPLIGILNNLAFLLKGEKKSN